MIYYVFRFTHSAYTMGVVEEYDGKAQNEPTSKCKFSL